MLAASVLLGGCTNDEPAEQSVDEPVAETTTAGPPEAQSYETVRSLVDAINDGGVECKDMKVLDAPQESIQEFGLCFISPEWEKDIYIFPSEDERNSWLRGFADNPEVDLLIGPNWLITSGSQDELEQIQGAIGGDMRVLDKG